MPRKTCDNPFGLPKGAYHTTSLCNCSASYIEDMKNAFPEKTWGQKLTLCVKCRTVAAEKLRERQAVKSVLNSIVKSVSHQIQVARDVQSPASSISGSMSVAGIGHEASAPPLESQGVNEPAGDYQVAGPSRIFQVHPPTYQSLSHPPLADLWPNVQPSSTTTQSEIYPNIQIPPRFTETSLYPNIHAVSSSPSSSPVQIGTHPHATSPTSQVQIETHPRATSPSSQAGIYPHMQEALPLSEHGLIPNFGAVYPSSQVGTNSDITLSSTIHAPSKTVSEYYDKSMPKEQLNRLLQSCSLSPVTATTKVPRRKILEKYGKMQSTVKNLVEKAFGGSLETAANCTCKYCVCMAEAIKNKITLIPKTKREKYLIMTCLPPSVTIPKMQSEYGLTSYEGKRVSVLRKESGPFSVPDWKSSAHPLPDATKNEVILFYLSDDNSRISSNSHETILIKTQDGIKDRVARRHMLTNLRDAYNEFKKTHLVKIGISKFAELRPKICRWPGHQGFPITCTCITHENFKLIVEGLQHAVYGKVQDQPLTNENLNKAVLYGLVKNVPELINSFLCVYPSEECYMGYCSNCPNEANITELMDLIDDSLVEFRFWQTKDTTTINKLTLSSEMFGDKFREVLMKYLAHDFIYQRQKSFISALKTSSLQGNSTAIVTVDFGENYSFVVQNAVQGFHWNNGQCTIHPFVVYYAQNGATHYKTYFIISDDLSHDASSFHAFRSKVLRLLSSQLPFIHHIEYVSDGAGSQYKNYKNICNLVHHKHEYGITANWHFSATAHGKSMCDAMSAVVKRFVRLKAINEGKLIVTADAMYNVAKENLEKGQLEFIFVSKEEIQLTRDMLTIRYEGARKIPGIRKFHCFEIEADGTVCARKYSSDKECEKFTIFIEDGAAGNRNEETSDLNLEEHYAVLIGNNYQIGKLLSVDPEADKYIMTMMRKVGQGGIGLLWPTIPKEQEVPHMDVLCRVDKPVFSTGSAYRLQPKDLISVKAALATRLATISNSSG